MKFEICGLKNFRDDLWKQRMMKIGKVNKTREKFALKFVPRNSLERHRLDLYFSTSHRVCFIHSHHLVMVLRSRWWKCLHSSVSRKSRREIEHLRVIENRKQIESIVSSSGAGNWHHRLKLSTCKVSWPLSIGFCSHWLFIVFRQFEWKVAIIIFIIVRCARCQLKQQANCNWYKLIHDPDTSFNCHWSWNGEHKNTSIINRCKQRR